MIYAATMATLDGIDIAHYQGNPNWAVIDTLKLQWFATKATQGAGYVDPTFHANWVGAAACKIPVRLAYHFLDMTATPEAQAAHCVATVGTLGVGEGIMLDMECQGTNAALAVRFCEAVEKATGRPVAVYSGAFFADVWHSTAVFNGHRPRILANANSETRAMQQAAPYKPDVWQYGSGPVAGIAATTDWDHVYNLHAFDACCGITATAPAPVATPTSSSASNPAPALATRPAVVAPASATRPVLKIGSHGEDVKLLQNRLGITADSIFGVHTQAAVRQFQTGHHLIVDGIVGPQTWKALGV